MNGSFAHLRIPGSSSRARQVATPQVILAGVSRNGTGCSTMPHSCDPQAAGSSVENRPLAALLDESKKASVAEGGLACNASVRNHNISQLGSQSCARKHGTLAAQSEPRTTQRSTTAA